MLKKVEDMQRNNLTIFDLKVCAFLCDLVYFCAY